MKKFWILAAALVLVLGSPATHLRSPRDRRAG